jgi:hypothetical protein
MIQSHNREYFTFEFLGRILERSPEMESDLLKRFVQSSYLELATFAQRRIDLKSKREAEKRKENRFLVLKRMVNAYSQHKALLKIKSAVVQGDSFSILFLADLESQKSLNYLLDLSQNKDSKSQNKIEFYVFKAMKQWIAKQDMARSMRRDVASEWSAVYLQKKDQIISRLIEMSHFCEASLCLEIISFLIWEIDYRIPIDVRNRIVAQQQENTPLEILLQFDIESSEQDRQILFEIHKNWIDKIKGEELFQSVFFQKSEQLLEYILTFPIDVISAHLQEIQKAAFPRLKDQIDFYWIKQNSKYEGNNDLFHVQNLKSACLWRDNLSRQYDLANYFLKPECRELAHEIDVLEGYFLRMNLQKKALVFSESDHVLELLEAHLQSLKMEFIQVIFGLLFADRNYLKIRKILEGEFGFKMKYSEAQTLVGRMEAQSAVDVESFLNMFCPKKMQVGEARIIV